MNTIEVSELGKAYRYYPTQIHRFLRWFGIKSGPVEDKWILRKVSFEAQAGEMIGIIGQNGAGKSTLLKMIVDSLKPSEGKIIRKGRLAAILELGMGFNPNLTGRQNAYHISSLMGYGVKEIRAAMPYIEEFADIGEAFDSHLRTYSSGMQMRLAFSVATAFRPDVLIIDEALSVGDALFQAKCFARVESMLKENTTILFVSHSLEQVRRFCSRAVYLKDGVMEAYGESASVCDLYVNDLAAKEKENSNGVVSESNYISQVGDFRKKSGTLELELVRFELYDEKKTPIERCDYGQTIFAEVVIKANQDVRDESYIGLLIADMTGYPLISLNANYYGVMVPGMRQGEYVKMTWSFDFPFSKGDYRFDLGLKADVRGSVYYDRVFGVKKVSVMSELSLEAENFGGIMKLDANVSAEFVSEQELQSAINVTDFREIKKDQKSQTQEEHADHDFSLTSGERQVAESYEEIRADHRYRYELVGEFFQGKDEKHLVGLDIFCGNGYGAYYLSNQNRFVTGVDGSKEAIELANKVYKTANNEFFAQQFPFKLEENKYDFVVCFESLEHVSEDVLMFEEIVNSVKRRGNIFVSVPNDDVHSLEKNPHPFHFRHYKNDDFLQAFCEGLELQAVYGQDVYVFNSDGTMTSKLLNDNDMRLIKGKLGQVSIFHLIKK